MSVDGKPTPTPTVDFDTATKNTQLWQTNNPNHCKAFLIPTADLLRTMAEMKIITIDDKGNIGGNFSASNNQDIRAYLAIDQTIWNKYKNDPKELKLNGYGEKLYLVGTQADPTNADNYYDVMYDKDTNQRFPAGTRLNIIGSGIYDFTRPCPTTCDPKSPLNH